MRSRAERNYKFCNMGKKKKGKRLTVTVEQFLLIYEKMSGKKLSVSDKKKALKYGIELQGTKELKKLSTKDLIFIRDIRAFQLEILDIMKCDKLEILV